MADPTSRGPQMEAVIYSFLGICLVSVSLRCYTMLAIMKRFSLEDYLAVAAMCLYVVFAALALVSIHYGLGSHLQDVSLVNRPIAFKYRWLAELAYIVESYLVKVIVGLLLIRICSASHQRWQRITIWSLLVFVGAFYFAYFFLAIFACQPVQYYYTRYNPIPAEGKCNSTAAATVITYIATLLNIVSDWTLALLPATVVWQAQLDLRTKISVSVVLGIGSIASVATIVRVFYAKSVLDNPDYLYNFTDMAIWSTVEIGMALTASCLATLKPLFRKARIFQSSTIKGPGSARFNSSYGPHSRRRRGSSAPWSPGTGPNSIQVQHSFGSFSAKKRASGPGLSTLQTDFDDEIAMIDMKSPKTAVSEEWSPATPKGVSFKNYEVEISAV